MKKFFWGFLSLIAYCDSGFAAVHLELTQGIDSAVPLAIVKFVGQNLGTADIADNLNAVMRQDFINTGRFRPIDTTGLTQPSDPSGVEPKYWRSQGVNDVVIGQINHVGWDRYDVTFFLVDVFKQQHIAAPDPTTAEPTVVPSTNVLVTKTFKNISSAQVRSLAHHIDDIIYLQLTGERGIFSTKIAYVSVQGGKFSKKRYLLEISDYDGNSPHMILNSPQPIMSPMWAPDAKHIAYVSFEDRFAAIYITNVMTGARQLISEFPGVNGAPAFSPDSRRLALVLTKTDQLKLYLMDLATRQIKRVTDGYSIDTEPNWAPDGKSLIFTSDRAGTPQIYSINLANKEISRLTFDGTYNARASYTPDAKNIVFLHRGDVGDPYSIATLNLDSGILRVLVQGYDIQSPSVAPNGSMIIYSNRDNGKGILAEVSIDGKVQLRLPAGEGDVREPAWSPYWFN